MLRVCCVVFLTKTLSEPGVKGQKQLATENQELSIITSIHKQDAVHTLQTKMIFCKSPRDPDLSSSEFGVFPEKIIKQNCKRKSVLVSS